ncbi:amylovoran biosynthesis protein AmsF [Erwinia sp. BNK-24-b]|uniref:amylovoran biosynthesis protein AmsF n=1 Tax=unclassified Erwinia TaxID=2622719 RepID=UPI0039BF2A67
MIDVNSFADLRTTAPTKTGDTAYLKRWSANDGNFRGGGQFVGYLTTPSVTDDNGTIAVGTNFYWKRIIDNPENINILHFGAVGDGYADDTEPFKRMLAWTLKYNSNIRDLPVRLPGGKFLIKPIDISATEYGFFGVVGDDVDLGSIPRTIIISDKSTSTVFKVNARRTLFKGIQWDGQATANTTTNTAAITATMLNNTQPFFENIITAGQTVNIYCFRAQYTGGTVFKLQDTLDSKFDQIYTVSTYSRVFDVGWSDTASGSWDHSTAIELSNANFQTGYGDATLYMPRMTQGIIRNVWIEHTRFPGDLSDGGWTIDTLNIEGCSNPMVLDNCRMMVRQLNLQAGAAISTNLTSTGRWLSTFEYGYRRDENFGSYLSGSLKAGYYSGHKITNTTATDNWYKVGQFFFPKANQQWVMEMIGKADTTAPSSTAASPITSPGSGRTIINMERGDTVWVEAYHMGTPAVLDIRYTRVGTTYVAIYVKLAANSGDTMFNLETTGPTRFESGSCSLFQPDFSVVTDTSTLGTLKPQARFGLHNGLAGIGANEKGVLTLATAAGTPTNKTTPTGFVLVNINGTDHKIPYYD